MAYGLLGDSMRKDYHDPAEDARISIKLYRTFARNAMKLRRAKLKLRRMWEKYEFPNFKIRPRYPICCGMYDPKRCLNSCDQPTARGLNGDQLRVLVEACHKKKDEELARERKREEELEPVEQKNISHDVFDVKSMKKAVSQISDYLDEKEVHTDE